MGLRRLGWAALLLASAASLASADDAHPAWLVGRWTGTEVARAFDLASDGGARAFATEGGEDRLGGSGTWSWAPGRLTVTGSAGAKTYEVVPREVDGRIDEFTIKGGDFAAPSVLRRAKATVASIVGRWIFENEYQKVVTVYLPDGRYVTDLVVGDVVVHERGTVRLEGNEIVFSAHTGETTAYEFRVAGDELTLSGGPLGEMVQIYGKEKGSEAKVVEEARVADAAKAKEDAVWAERIAVGVWASRPPHVAAGEVPADPAYARVFEKPTVFKALQAYVWTSAQTLGVERRTGLLREQPYGDPDPEIDPAKGEYHNTTKWFFLPTGRFFYKGTKYLVGGSPASPQVTMLWGRYMLEGDVLRVDTDDEEQQSLDLLDGRRNLRFGEMTYSVVVPP